MKVEIPINSIPKICVVEALRNQQNAEVQTKIKEVCDLKILRSDNAKSINLVKKKMFNV